MPCAPFRSWLVAFLGTMILIHGVFFYTQWPHIRSASPDFTIFYTAGKILGLGRGRELYNADLERAVQKKFSLSVANGGPILPFNHPPYEAAIFAPLAVLPYTTAYLAWFAINVGIALAFLVAVRQQLTETACWPLWLGVLAVFAFPPLFISFLQGQDDIWVLFCYGMVYTALCRKREFTAGMWLAAALGRFHLVVPFLLAFFVQRRPKVVAGFVLIAAALVSVGLGVVGVQTSLHYPAYVWRTDHAPVYLWTHYTIHANVRALVMSALPTGQNHLADVIVIVVSLSLLLWSAVTWKQVSPLDVCGWKLGFALNMVTTLLVSYHTLVHDMSLLLLPILIVADVLSSQARIKRPVRLIIWGSITALFLSPLYFALLLRWREFFLMTFAVLFFMAAMILLMRAVRKSAEPLGMHAPTAWS